MCSCMLIQLVLCEGSEMNSTGFSSVTKCFLPSDTSPAAESNQPSTVLLILLSQKRPKYTQKFRVSCRKEGRLPGCYQAFLQVAPGYPIWCNGVRPTVYQF
jgi:hypothetical protein